MFHRNEIELIVTEKAAIAAKATGTEGITMDATLGEDLLLSSLASIELTLLLEAALDMRIPLARVVDSATLGDCADLIEGLLAQGMAAQS